MKKRNFLIVDDNPNNLKILAGLINQMGHIPILCQSGFQALEYLKDEDADLVLLDVMMPELNGYEVCKKIKSDFPKKDIPIIFVTAKNDIDSELNAFEFGGVDFISKPFNSSVITARITTQLKLIESKEKLNNKINELTELNAEKDKFLNILAHDLRNPFFGILGLLEITLKRSDKLDKNKILEQVEKVFKLSKNVYSLFEKLIDWGKFRSGLYNIKIEEINIKNSIYEIIDIYRDIANKKNISLEFNMKEECNLKFDNYIFSTIFRNLINNAIKFTHNEGRVEVNVQRDENFTIIIVKDNGVGMTKEKLDNLFKISYNSSSKGTTGEKGSGLGLLLVKEMIDLNKLKLEISTNLNEGSEFKVYFDKNYII
jgi:signal transduction histidine kinase